MAEQKSFFDFGMEAQQPSAQLKPWMKKKKMILGTEENLTSVIDACVAAGRYALDLETTGLDKRVFNGRTKDSIVGVCLSPDGVHGYYFPLRHKKGEEHNLSPSKVEAELRRLEKSPSVAIFHNAKFDCEFLQFTGSAEPIGLWDDPRKYEDTLILAWLRDTRERRKGLKHLAKTELGFEMIELEELFPPDHTGNLDFSLLDPSSEFVIAYGASDAICTYELFKVLHPQVLEPGGNPRDGQGFTYSLEKMCLPATRWMERCRINVDQDKVVELIRLGQQEYFDCLIETYDFCNQALGRCVEPGWFQILRKKFVADNADFNINSQIQEARLEAKRTRLDELDSKGHFFTKQVRGKEYPLCYDVLSRPQLGPLFEELRIPGLRRTEKSGQVKTTQDEIDRLNQEHGAKFPFLPKIKRLGELIKALGTYLIALRTDIGPDGTLSPNFNQFGTDTGRYTTPASKKPELDGGTSFPVHGTPASHDKSRPQCLLRIREAIAARPGKVMAGIDFGGVELRIATNYSGEPLWLDEFFRCSTCKLEFSRGDGNSTPEAPPAYCPRCGDDRIGDLHTKTGIVFYGEDKVGTKEWKQLRGQSKSANFALAYGGSHTAIMRSTGCEEDEARRHHRAFNEAYTGLKGWWEKVKKEGLRYGYVKTALGRHYPIPDIQLPVTSKDCPNVTERELNKKFKAKAERNATNGPVQGLSADITKIAMALIYREIKARGWFDKVFMVITIHDELVFEIDKDILVEALEVIQHVMTRNKTILNQKWPVPLTTDCEIGYNWTVPYDIKNFKFKRVRQDGTEVDFKGNPVGKVWPKELIELFGPRYGYAPDAPVEEGDAAPTQERLETPKAPLEPVEEPEDPSVFVLKLRAWDQNTIDKLATIIVECRGKGDKTLKIRTFEGEEVQLGLQDILVDPVQVKAKAYDLDV